MTRPPRGWLPLGIAWLVAAAAFELPSATADSRHGVPLPARSRARDDGSVESRRSFRRTVRFYDKHFARRGAAVRRLPTSAYRGVLLARFLSTAPNTSWRAVHVFKHRGRTFISVVPQSAADAAPKPLTPKRHPR